MKTQHGCLMILKQCTSLQVMGWPNMFRIMEPEICCTRLNSSHRQQLCASACKLICNEPFQQMASMGMLGLRALPMGQDSKFRHRCFRILDLAHHLVFKPSLVHKLVHKPTKTLRQSVNQQKNGHLPTLRLRTIQPLQVLNHPLACSAPSACIARVREHADYSKIPTGRCMRLS